MLEEGACKVRRQKVFQLGLKPGTPHMAPFTLVLAGLVQSGKEFPSRASTA